MLFANGPIVFIQVQTVEKKELENVLLSVNVILASFMFPVLSVRTKIMLWDMLLCFDTLLYTRLITASVSVPNRFSGIGNFRYLKLGIRDS